MVSSVDRSGGAEQAALQYILASLEPQRLSLLAATTFTFVGHYQMDDILDATRVDPGIRNLCFRRNVTCLL
jgi:hypothetical protein